MNLNNETITLPEIGELLALAAARDQRTVGTADNIAWWQDLNVARVTLADAKAALAHYYANVWPRQDPKHRFRATAPAIIEIVLEIRAQRFANFVYEPDPDESGAEYVRRLRTQLTAVSNGCSPAHPATELPSRPVAALVAGIAEAKAMPAEVFNLLADRRFGPRSIRCPKCSAEPRARCTTEGGKQMQAPHPMRIDAHAVQTATCPECHVAAGDGCRQMGQPYPGAHPGRVKAAAVALRVESGA
jgi:hypothetical protein